MGKGSGIEWTDHTWNPWQGCHKVSAGCDNCYMYREKQRYGQDPTTIVRSKPATFNAPLKWQDPSKIFVCSWSDFFIREADPWRAEALKIIDACPHHTFIAVTKRPDRIIDALAKTGTDPSDSGSGWSVPAFAAARPNLWILTTVENQEQADLRIPQLLKLREHCPTWPILGVSCEPLLEQIDIQLYLDDLDWVIAGAESGPNRRPADPDWFHSLLCQCICYQTPYYLKQMDVAGVLTSHPHLSGQPWTQSPPTPSIPNPKGAQS